MRRRVALHVGVGGNGQPLSFGHVCGNRLVQAGRISLKAFADSAPTGGGLTDVFGLPGQFVHPVLERLNVFHCPVCGTGKQGMERVG